MDFPKKYDILVFATFPGKRWFHCDFGDFPWSVGTGLTFSSAPFTAVYSLKTNAGKQISRSVLMFAGRARSSDRMK